MAEGLSFRPDLTQKSFWDKAFRPWDVKEADCLAKTGYWITFFVLGIITSFIPHLVYNLVRCCSPGTSDKPTQYPYKAPPEAPPEYPQVTVITGVVKSRGKKAKRTKELPTSSRLTPASALLDSPPTKPKSNPLPDRKPLLGDTGTSTSGPLSPTPPKKGSKSTPPYRPPFSTPYSSYTRRKDERVVKLESLRSIQNSKRVKPLSRVTPLAQLCLKAMALKSEEVTKKAMPFTTSYHFVNNAAPLFRSETSMREKHVIGALSVWPNCQSEEDNELWETSYFELEGKFIESKTEGESPGTCSLDLYGCTHITLTEKVLVHKKFTSLMLTGCQFDNIDLFLTNVSKQKDLYELSTGFDAVSKLSTFQALMKGCPEITNLECAVDVGKGALFESPTNIEHLSVYIPTLNSAIVENILKQCPHLKSIAITTGNIEKLDLKSLLSKRSSKKIKYFTVILDAPKIMLHKPKIQDHDGVEICFTQVSTKSIFSFASTADSINFSPPSFISNIRRFKQDPNRTQMLLKGAATSLNSSRRGEDLWICGQIFAGEMNYTDLLAFEKVFEPCSLEAGESAAEYNVNLELMLRSGLKYCESKVKKSKAEFYDAIYLKKQVLTRILDAHTKIFELSSSIVAT